MWSTTAPEDFWPREQPPDQDLPAGGYREKGVEESGTFQEAQSENTAETLAPPADGHGSRSGSGLQAQ